MIPSPLGREVRETALLAAPVVVTQLGLVSLSTVDSVIVKPLGTVALGAVGLGNSIFFTVTLLALGTILALDPLVARAFGAGDRSRCGALLWQGIWLACALGLPLMLLFIDFEWGLTLLRQPPEIVEAAGDYLRGRAWHVPTLLVFAAERGFLNGVGNTRPVMVVVVLANVVNAALVYALVHGVAGLPRLGVAGAGYGTAAAGLFMAAATAWVVHGARYRDYATAPQRPDWPAIGRIVRFGLPIGGTLVAEVGVFAATFAVMGHLGPTAAAAHQVAITLASNTFMVPLGISVAASVRVGQALGRRRPDEALRACGVAYALAIGAMVASTLVFWLAPEPLARLFTDDPEVVPLAVLLIWIGGLFQISDGAQAVGSGCLRGAGDTRTPFVVNVLAHWGLGFPLGYALAMGAGLGAAGLWYGLTASLTAVAVLLAWRFRSAPFRNL